LESARKSIARLHRAANLSHKLISPDHDELRDFYAAINDDMNTPLALSTLSPLVTRINSGENTVRLCATLQHALYLMGLDDINENEDKEIEDIIAARNIARQEKRWNDADVIREELNNRGIDIFDSAVGTTWEYRA
jgi:cysteinyl-tRNA synthetase